MTKADLQAKIVLLERRIAGQEKEKELLRGALRRIAGYGDDDLPDFAKEQIANGWNKYPLLTGGMKAVAENALDGYFRGPGDGGEG